MKLKNIFHLDLDQNRVFGLDVLRMIAILLVVVSHSLSFMPQKISHLLDRILLDGVGIFFLLSGFLIGKILIQTFEKTNFNWVDIKIFWFKRWSRTLPNYYFFLLLLALINYQTVADILVEVWQNKEFIFTKLKIELKKEYLGVILFFSFWIISVSWSILQYKYFEVKSTNFLRKRLLENN